MSDERPLDGHPGRAGGEESEDDRHQQIDRVEVGQKSLEQIGRQVGHLGAQDHELAVRQFDHAHLS